MAICRILAPRIGACSDLRSGHEHRRPLPVNPPPATLLRHDAQVIALVGTVHLISPSSQLLLAPLFPWLKVEFNVSYAELGFLMTIFFAVSCGVQALSGLLVDRVGPWPMLFGGLALLGLAM